MRKSNTKPRQPTEISSGPVYSLRKIFIHNTHQMKDRRKFPCQQQVPPLGFARPCLSFSCSRFRPCAISCLALHIPSQPSTLQPPCLLHLGTLYSHSPCHLSGYWHQLWMVTTQTEHAQALPLPQGAFQARPCCEYLWIPSLLGIMVANHYSELLPRHSFLTHAKPKAPKDSSLYEVGRNCRKVVGNWS